MEGAGDHRPDEGLPEPVVGVPLRQLATEQPISKVGADGVVDAQDVAGDEGLIAEDDPMEEEGRQQHTGEETLEKGLRRGEFRGSGVP